MADQVENKSRGWTLLVAIAIEMFGGVAMLPTPSALKLAGWPGTSHEAICLARREHRLPVVEIKIGSRYYVTAGAFATAFLARTEDATSTDDGTAAAPLAHRMRGRPRKSVVDEVAT